MNGSKLEGAQPEIPSHAWIARAGVFGIVAFGFVATACIDAMPLDVTQVSVPTQKLMRNPWERSTPKKELVASQEEILYFYW